VSIFWTNSLTGAKSKQFRAPHMSNSISPHLVKGTVGELLVQLRLLQFDVQAAPPLKDSGNDLIAVRCKTFLAIQIKTTAGDTYRVDDLPEFYNLLAVVQLKGEASDLHLDTSRIFLIPKERVSKASRQIEQLGEYALSREYIEDLFGPRHHTYYEPITS
jgi:hypothetical protein